MSVSPCSTAGAASGSKGRPIDRHETFLRIFMPHEPAIRAFVRHLVPLRSDVDDVMQEVAVVLWQRFDTFRPDGNFKAWALGVARFKVLSRLRDLHRDRLILANDVLELLAAESETNDAHFQEQRDVLENCFGKMPERDRDLLMKSYSTDAKIQEIARLNGLSRAALYKWLYRIRRLLLECIHREQARRA
ncbi:sigma-70 family RNA polymerase sigma factor [Planctomicrobium sp. SH661]|uniref:sigma-70 family RNA polymerase sigma factor n=1 Tax=Planctomicrobium sp. SH661 TaxID=3448124 RepID=UPI003F5C27AA